MNKVDLEEHDDTWLEDIRLFIQELAALCGIPAGEVFQPTLQISDGVALIKLVGPEADAECKFFLKNLPEAGINTLSDTKGVEDEK